MSVTNNSAPSYIRTGRVEDPRNTNEAWCETCAFHIHLSADDVRDVEDIGFECEWVQLPPMAAGDDAELQSARDADFIAQFQVTTHAEMALLARDRL
jgi:hypothetical protein